MTADFAGYGLGAANRIRLRELEGPQPVRWSDVFEAPEVLDPLLGPIVSRGEVASLFGPTGTGKSLLAQEAALALATGGTFLGDSLAPATVLYADQENGLDVWRHRAESLGYGPTDDLDGRFYLFCLDRWLGIDTMLGARLLIDRAEIVQPALVVIDTQSKFLNGPENDADTIRAVYRHTLLPLKQLGAAVLVLDHPGKDVTRGARGSSAKGDDVDTTWQLTSRGRDGITLRRTKARRQNPEDVLYVQRDAGPPLRHVLETVDQRAEEVIATCLDKLRLLGLDPSDSRNEAAQRLRQDGHKFRDSTVSEAFRRWRSEQ